MVPSDEIAGTVTIVTDRETESLRRLRYGNVNCNNLRLMQSMRAIEICVGPTWNLEYTLPNFIITKTAKV